MKPKSLNTIFKMYVFATVSLLCSGIANAQVIYSNGFESLINGLVDDSQVKAAWNSRYAKGPDEGRVSIVNDSYSGVAARIKYPAFANQSSPSGATWETDLNIEADELYMAYWVKVDSDFQFVKGGKLPGLAGSTSFPYGDREFTTRLMWREDGKLEFYLHGFEMANNAGAEPYRVFWDHFGTHVRLIKGQWHHIEIRQKLNSPGQLNGRLQGWLDGQLACDSVDNSGVRAAGQGDTKLNHLYFSTFFGGSSSPVTQWQPTNDVYATFDEFTVSTQRIGIGGNEGGTGGGENGGGDNGGDNGGGDNGGGGISNPGSCTSATVGRSRNELDLSQSNCIEFDQSLTGKTIQVWDSDTNSSCNYRGLVTSTDGTQNVVSGNYHSFTGFNGQTLTFDSSNACEYVKVRAY